MLIHFISKEYNAIGITGVSLILLAYLLLQLDRLDQNSVFYSLINLLGSGFILISLIYAWNLSSVVIEIAWFVISFFGLSKAIYILLRVTR